MCRRLLSALMGRRGMIGTLGGSFTLGRGDGRTKTDEGRRRRTGRTSLGSAQLVREREPPEKILEIEPPDPEGG